MLIDRYNIYLIDWCFIYNYIDFLKSACLQFSQIHFMFLLLLNFIEPFDFIFASQCGLCLARVSFANFRLQKVHCSRSSSSSCSCGNPFISYPVKSLPPLPSRNALRNCSDSFFHLGIFLSGLLSKEVLGCPLLLTLLLVPFFFLLTYLAKPSNFSISWLISAFLALAVSNLGLFSTNTLLHTL